MMKTVRIALSSLCLLICSTQNGWSQQIAKERLTANNLVASLSANGELLKDFWAEGDSSMSLVFSSGIMISGFDQSQNLYVSNQHYGTSDFTPGPYPPLPGDDTLYNRVWHLTQAQVDSFLYWYEYNLYMNTDPWPSYNYSIPQDLLDWPAHGDYNGGQGFYLAPFNDRNNDGVYNTIDGDTPDIPCDEALYAIMHDSIQDNTGGSPMAVELHIMMYACDCPDDSASWNTVYADIKLINRSNMVYSNTKISIVNDFDVGSYTDNHFGSDVARGMTYGYSSTTDMNQGSYPFGTMLPALGMTWLSGVKQPDDGIDNPLVADYAIASSQDGIPYAGLGTGFGDGIIDNEKPTMGSSGLFGLSLVASTGQYPATENEWRNLCDAKWIDGSLWQLGSCGHVQCSSSGTDTKYMFPANSDTLGWGSSGVSMDWSQFSEQHPGSDMKSMSSTIPVEFYPDSSIEVSIAYTYARDYQSQGIWKPVEILQERSDSIRNTFNSGERPCDNTLPLSVPGATNSPEVNVYPNPAKENITSTERIQEYKLYDFTGRLTRRGQPNLEMATLDISTLSTGPYLLIINTGQGTVVKKLVVE